MRTESVNVPRNWKTLKPHPLSELTEFGVGIDINAMAEHMRQHGYDPDEAVVLYEGMILDGRHRNPAAALAGVTPTFKRFIGKDPVAYVCKKAFRQHLNISQRAMLAAALAKLPVGRPGPENVTNVTITQTEAADAMNVSRARVVDARKVQESGTPELQDAVKDGTVSVSDAAKVAILPPAVQEEAVNAVRNGDARSVFAAANAVSTNGHAEEPALPERIAPFFASVKQLNNAARLATRLANVFQEVEGTAAYQRAFQGKKQHVYSTTIRAAARMVERITPTKPCPDCGGLYEPSEDSEPCKACEDKGYLTADEVS